MRTPPGRPTAPFGTDYTHAEDGPNKAAEQGVIAFLGADRSLKAFRRPRAHLAQVNAAIDSLRYVPPRGRARWCEKFLTLARCAGSVCAPISRFNSSAYLFLHLSALECLTSLADCLA